MSLLCFVQTKTVCSATVIVCTGGSIWLNPFATVLFNVCSAVTVQCCVLYPCCVGVFGMFAVMYLLRRGIWVCMRCACLCLCWVLG